MDVLRGVGKIMSTLKNPYKYYFIYKTINLINKKCYVGFHATNEEYDEYFGSGIMLNNAIKKYGIQNFIRGIIEYINPDEWQEKEQYWIKEMRSHINEWGYNLTYGGDGMLGNKHTEETKEKIKSSNKKTWKNEELRKTHSKIIKKTYENNEIAKNKLSKSAICNWKNEEYRNNFTKKMNKKYEDPDFINLCKENTTNLWKISEFRKKTSNAIKNGWNDDELRKKRGKGGILKIKNNIIIKEYCSTRVAAKYENTTHVTIISNCNRRIKDKNGYEWFYRDDYEKKW
jgi:group I intron endonuclease